MWKLLTLLTWEKFLNWEIPSISRELEIQMGGNYKLCVSIQQTFIKAAINHIGIKGGGTSPCHQVDHRPMNKGKSWIRRRNIGLLPGERGCLIPEHGPGVSSGASLVVTQGYAQILSGPFLCAWAGLWSRFCLCFGAVSVEQGLSLKVFSSWNGLLDTVPINLSLSISVLPMLWHLPCSCPKWNPKSSCLGAASL